MQGDGNLVVYGPECPSPNGACWDSRSFGHPGAALAVQNDGNLCIFGSACNGTENVCWCSRE
jgi:hypothetical protein